MLSKRTLLTGASVTAVAAACGACTTTSTGTTINPDVLDAINKVIAATCNSVAMASTIVAIVSAAFPALAGAATISAEVAAEIASIFCKAAAQPTASGRYMAKLNDAHVEVHGWIVRNGKVEQF